MNGALAALGCAGGEGHLVYGDRRWEKLGHQGSKGNIGQGHISLTSGMPCAAQYTPKDVLNPHSGYFLENRVFIDAMKQR